MRRVKILGGMTEFVGKTGTVVRKEMGMLRVKLDEPVEIPGVGTVSDDLWEPQFLETIRRCEIETLWEPKLLKRIYG